MQGDLCVRRLGKQGQEKENSDVREYFLWLFRVLELDSVGLPEENEGWRLSSTYCAEYFPNSGHRYTESWALLAASFYFAVLVLNPGSSTCY